MNPALSKVHLKSGDGFCRIGFAAALHLSQTSSTPFGASSQPSAQLYEHAHALPSDKAAALASQVRTSPVGNGGAHGNGGNGGGGSGGGGAPPVIAKSYSVAAPHVGEA